MGRIARCAARAAATRHRRAPPARARAVRRRGPPRDPPLDRADRPVQERVQHDRHDRRRDQHVGRRRCVRTPSSRPRVARMNENSPICASATATVSAVRERVAQQPTTMTSATSGLPTSTIASAPSDEARRLEDTLRDRAACPPRRRTARRTRRASAARRTPPAGCSRIGRRPCRRGTRRAPSTRRRSAPSRRRCRARARAPSA